MTLKMTNQENDQQPLVSVCMITYNHEKFISEAIEGVLMQETTFPIELVIGEDCSTDNTAKIIEGYAGKYPNLIRARCNKSNMGMTPNIIQTLKECSGKYIALCEGDDYWTDPNKLQKQVDFLECNKDYAICFHNSKVLKNGEIVDNYLKNIVNDTTTILDLARENYIYTALCLTRNYFSNGLPEFYQSCPAGDYLLWMLSAQNGKIKYIDEVMSVYRVHEGGIWSTKTTIEKIEASALVQKILMENFDGEVKNILAENYIILLNKLLKKYKNEYNKSIRISNGIKNPYFIRENTSLKVIIKALIAKIQFDVLKLK